MAAPITPQEALRRRHSSQMLLVTEESFNEFHQSFVPQIEERYGLELLARTPLSNLFELEYDLRHHGQSLLSLYARINTRVMTLDAIIPSSLSSIEKTILSEVSLLKGCPIVRQIVFEFPNEKSIATNIVGDLYQGIYAQCRKELVEIPYRLSIEIAQEVHQNANHILLSIELLQHQLHVGEYIAYYVAQDNTRIVRYSGERSEAQFLSGLRNEFPNTYGAFAVRKLEPELMESAKIDQFNIARIVDEFEEGLNN